MDVRILSRGGTLSGGSKPAFMSDDLLAIQQFTQRHQSQDPSYPLVVISGVRVYRETSRQSIQRLEQLYMLRTVLDIPTGNLNGGYRSTNWISPKIARTYCTSIVNEWAGTPTSSTSVAMATLKTGPSSVHESKKDHHLGTIRAGFVKEVRSVAEISRQNASFRWRPTFLTNSYGP